MRLDEVIPGLEKVKGMSHWSSVKDFELLNLSVFHTNYALHERDPISRMACCNLFDQANLVGLATGIDATSRFLP